jgi:hypothetical protein
MRSRLFLDPISGRMVYPENCEPTLKAELLGFVKTVPRGFLNDYFAKELLLTYLVKNEKTS